MAEDADETAETEAPPRSRRRWPLVLGALAGCVVLVAGLAWFNRESLADRLIAGQLESLGLPATYEIDRIGTDRQVLTGVVIGDPRAPDMTIERVEISGVLDRIVLVRPRLFGSLRNGKPSFGSLDKVLFTGSKEPFRLPDLNVAVVDGRARIDTDFGPAGVKLEGEGPLRGGFKGVLAAVMPRAEGAGCRAAGASLYGKLSVSAERPRFAGPLRLASLACDNGLKLARASLQVDGTADQRLDGGDLSAALRAGPAEFGANRLAGLGGALRATWRKQALRASYDLAGVSLRTPQAAMRTIGLDGVLRAAQGFARIDLEGRVTGGDLALGNDLDATLAGVQRSGEGTLVAPLLAQIRTALRREGQGSRLAANYVLRKRGPAINLVVPQGSLQGASGGALLAVSRAQLTADGVSPARIAGNVATGGAGMPRISGRLERTDDKRLITRLAMAEYRAGKSAVAVPELVVVQAANGSLGLAGRARISGALPGGEVTNLLLPIDGNWSARGGFALWRRCTPLRFDSLALANLKLDGRTVTLCPPASAGAILRSGPGGLRIAAGAPSLDVVGRLGASPIRIASGPIGFAVPGNLSARRLDIALGPAATASRFSIANLSAKIGKDIAGTFDGSDVRLAAVPLDLLGAAGKWRFADGRLTIVDGAFRLEDRQSDDRFQPLVAQGGTLTLADNRIVAEALLREPASSREVVRTAIRHDLASGTGNADLFVDGLVFDDKVQPDTVSRLALGVIANARGTVRGTGRIDWNPRAVTSTGRFSTDALDFAAAFGPVKGLSGEVVFTDLLGMVTAPDQRVRIASVNPGIEVNDGELSFALRPNMQLAVNGAKWPFMGGTLTLEPTRMTFGVAETRRYTLMVEALDAAKFVQRLELSNLSASGIFDGKMPLVFDENGGRVEGGLLLSRPPGGNVSYVGELTYKDLSAMGNFAFNALRSVDYRQMRIEMNGAIDGEIVTRIGFDGLSQGTGASRNFLTDKVASLPIRFNVNLRAPFMQLMSSFRSLYDTSLVRDPASLGLLDGKPKSESIQPSDSENER